MNARRVIRRYGWIVASRREAVTLIELLVVVSLILVVSVIVLRSLAPALQSRNLREGARMVSVFISGARARAAQTGRSSGVWIDRVPNFAQGSFTLFNASIPEAYSGDTPNSGLVAYMSSQNIAGAYRNWYQELTNNTTNLILSNVVAPWGTTGYTDLWGQGPNNQKLIQPGDFIRINNSKYEYRLQVCGNATAAGWKIGDWRNYGGGVRPVNFRPYGPTESPVPTEPLISAPSPLAPLASPVGLNDAQRLPFQIFRQPRRNAGGGITLPDSVVIDLNYSGTAGTPFLPRQRVQIAGGTYLNPSSQPNPYSGIPISGSQGRYVQTPNNQDPDADMQPIIIVFDKSGAVERMYCRWWDGGVSPASYPWEGRRVDSNIYLLIGKREKLPINSADTLYPLAKNYAAGSPLMNQGNYNWTDTDNFIVAIRPSSGAVYVSENAGSIRSVDTNNQGKRSQLNVWQNIGSQSTNTNIIDGLNDHTDGTRRRAAAFFATGGK